MVFVFVSFGVYSFGLVGMKGWREGCEGGALVECSVSTSREFPNDFPDFRTKNFTTIFFTFLLPWYKLFRDNEFTYSKVLTKKVSFEFLNLRLLRYSKHTKLAH